MGKKKDDNGELTSFSAGGRPGREHPNGWSAERRDLKKSDDTTEVYGYGPGRGEGWHSVK